jgi:dolichyl-phosphate beta-glucosyltransferase
MSTLPAVDPPPTVDVTLILPCYHAAPYLAESLRDAARFLDTLGCSWEILAVDDGSRDKDATWNRIVEAAREEPRVRPLRLPRNQGKGGAVRHGVLEARGRHIVFTDADLPYRFRDLRAVVHFLREGRCDMVMGDRLLPGSSYRGEINRTRGWMSAAFSRFVEFLFTPGVFDTQCGLKGFSAPVARGLARLQRIRGFAFDIEYIYIALKHRVAIKRIPVVLRRNESSTLTAMNAFLEILVDLLRVWVHRFMGRYDDPALLEYALRDYTALMRSFDEETGNDRPDGPTP